MSTYTPSDFEQRIRQEFIKRASAVPTEFSLLLELSLDDLRIDVQRLPKKERLFLAKFGSLMSEVETVKNYTAKGMRPEEIAILRNGFFYLDIVPIQAFYEFWKDVSLENAGNEINKLISLLSNGRINKLRNSIAHADFSIAGETIRLNDRNVSLEFNLIELCSLASSLSWLAVLLGEWSG